LTQYKDTKRMVYYRREIEQGRSQSGRIFSHFQSLKDTTQNEMGYIFMILNCCVA
jgi:hypothetical protein